MTDRKISWESVKKELARLRSSVAASDALTAKSTESQKTLETVFTEVVSMKVQVTCMDTEKLDSNRSVAEVRKDTDKLMVRLNVALVGDSWVKKLSRSLVTESVNTVNAVIQQLGHETVTGLRKDFEMAYSTVRVSFAVAFTRVSGVAATSVCWEGEESADEQEAELAEGRPAETRQGYANVARPRGSGKKRSARR